MDSLIHLLIFGESLGERFDAQLKLRFDYPVAVVVRPIFESFRSYIRELVMGQRIPRGENYTPFLQFHDGFAQIQFLFWNWHPDEPIIETLVEMLNDPEPHLRALAIVGLGAGNVMWKETSRVEPYLHQGKQDSDTLICVASRFTQDYMQFGEYVQQKTSPDMTMLQRLEQYSAQMITGLIRE
jgi:hypothetical protein